MARADDISAGSKAKRTLGFTPVVLTVILLCLLPGNVDGKLEDGGDIYVDEVVEKWQSPLTIKNDVIIRKGATVKIKPGVELRFNPGVMMAVNGTLIAVVSCLAL